MRRSEALPQLRHRAEAVAGGLPPLLVAAERVAQTVAQGVHGRRRSGIGETFWQFRPYQPGDSPQRIDWRQTAKGQTVYIREQEWSAAQTVWLWRDASPSMRYRSPLATTSKRERADLLLLAVASLLGRAGERVALIGGDGPPATGHVDLSRIAVTLERAAAADRDGLPDDVPVPAHAELVLLSDFLMPLETMDGLIGGLARRDVRGHLLQVLDPAEETLPFQGRVRFLGLEGEDDTLVPRVESIRPAYVQRLQAHRAGLSELARAAGWSFAVHHTDRPPTAALLTLHAALGGDGGRRR